MPGISYQQGSRQMVVAVMDPLSLMKTVSKVTEWNPFSVAGFGQRTRDAAHLKGIADYLEKEPDFILGSIVLYATPNEVSFTPTPDPQNHYNGDAGQPGTISVKVGTQFFIGDGQHRAGGYSAVFEKFSDDEDNPVMRRLQASGQPLIIVIDPDPMRRGQDFADLATTKPMTKSTGYSMDRRQPLNRLVLNLVKNPNLEIFGRDANGNVDGSRVEFLRDTPGALSAKLFSYKTVRFVSGLVLGAPLATGKTWDRKADEVAGREDADAALMEFWSGLSSIPAYEEICHGERLAADIRKETYLLSSGMLHAIAWGSRLAREKGVSLPDYFSAIREKVDFHRPRGGDKPTQEDPLTREETIFAGTLVDPTNGTIQGNKDAWTATAEQLASIAVG